MWYDVRVPNSSVVTVRDRTRRPCCSAAGSWLSSRGIIFGPRIAPTLCCIGLALRRRGFLFCLYSESNQRRVACRYLTSRARFRAPLSFDRSFRTETAILCPSIAMLQTRPPLKPQPNPFADEHPALASSNRSTQGMVFWLGSFPAVAFPPSELTPAVG